MRVSVKLTAAFLAGLGCMSFSATMASAQTLEQALIGAYEYHPSLSVSRSALRAADESVAQARAGKRPSVTASARAGLTSADRFDGRVTDTSTISIDGSLPLIDGGSTAAAVAGALANVDRARAALVGTEQTVLLAAVTAYGDVRRDTQFVSLAQNNVRVITSQLQAARDRFEVGEVTRTDVAQARARLAAAQSNLVANEGALARSREAYIAAIGSAPEDLAPPPALPALPATLADAEGVALRTHPSVVAAQELVRVAEADVDRARAASRPTLTATAQIASSGTAQDTQTDTATVGLQASVPLYRGGALSSQIRQAQATLDQRNAELQDAGRQVRQNVASAWANLTVARSSIEASRQQITAARVAFEGVREEARLGARTTLEVLDGEQELLNAQSNLVSAERDEYVAVYSLLAAMGLLTVQHLGLEVEQYDPVENFNRVQSGPYSTSRGDALDRILGRY
jgi:outer membrane protein